LRPWLRDNAESSSQLNSITTVAAAWDTNTGKAFVGWKITGKGGPNGDGCSWCAEDDVIQQATKAGSKIADLQLVTTVRPRTQKPIEVCADNCQEKWDPEQGEIADVPYVRGARWDRIKAQAQYDITGLGENPGVDLISGEPDPEAFTGEGWPAGEGIGLAEGFEEGGDE